VHREMQSNTTYGILVDDVCSNLKLWKSSLYQGTCVSKNIVFSNVFKTMSNMWNIRALIFPSSNWHSSLVHLKNIYFQILAHVALVLRTLLNYISNSWRFKVLEPIFVGWHIDNIGLPLHKCYKFVANSK